MSISIEKTDRQTGIQEKGGAGLDLRSSETNEAFKASLERFRNLERAFLSIGELVGYIRQDTGWDVDVSKLEFEVVPRGKLKQVWTEDVGARAGYTTAEWEQISEALESQGNLWTKLTSWIAARTMGASLGGLYLPSKDKIVLVEENLAGFNEQGLRKILYHELIHAAQEQKFEGLFKSVGKLGREALEIGLREGSKGDAFRNTMDTFNARMAWIEGQPTYLQEIKTAERFPGAKLNVCLGTHVLSIFSLASSGARRKMVQYRNGKRAFEKLYASEGDRKYIDLAFSTPELADLMLKSRGEVKFKLKEGASEEQKKALVGLIQYFAGKSSAGTGTLRVVIEDSKS